MDIKEILDNYSEQPSEEVWKRLSERLDAEMPVARSRRTVWKWVAAAVGVVAVGGGLTFGLLRYQHDGKQTAMNGTEQTASAQPQEAAAETQNMASLQEESPVVVETHDRVSQQDEKPTIVMEQRRDSSSQEASSTVVDTRRGASPQTETPKANVRQEVLPPNSTLAKQLAADPVLKNLSDDSVDWSLPAHLSIPNLFTPNGDGVNDFFVIEGLENYASPRLVVRDKSNRVVFQSPDYANTWDGASCPEGVYSYELHFTYNNIETQATGKVRIIRS